MNYIIDDSGFRRFKRGAAEPMIVFSEQIELETISMEGEEQYYFRFFGRTVGYLHIRSHHMEVICPEEGGDDVVYEANVAGWFKFEDWEREYHLMMAKMAVTRWLEDNGFWFFLT